MAADRFTPPDDPRPDDRQWAPLRWPLEAGVRLQGSFVELKPVVPEEDAGAVFAALDHDAVWQHVAGRPGDPAAFAAALGDALTEGKVPWVVRLVRPYAGLEPGTVVGTSSYLEVSVADARLEIGSTLYSPGVWGSAINPEAKLLLLAHAFEVLGAGRVQLKTDIRNTRSQQAIARLGARCEGVLRRYQRRADGTVRDTVLFSITAEEWPAVRDGLNERLTQAPR